MTKTDFDKLPDELKALYVKLPNQSSEEVRECFPETGKSSGVGFKKRNDEEWGMTADIQFPEYNDSGNASRFFKSIIYQGKANKKDRGEYNNHPTVKPTPLMEYLVKMVTKKGGTVLDPFNGSGSTGVACVKNGYNYIGIDLSEEYLNISEERIQKEINTALK